LRFGIPFIAANVRVYAPNGSMAATIALVTAAAGSMSARYTIIVCGADGRVACDGGFDDIGHPGNAAGVIRDRFTFSDRG
jgi:hypothetical protein